MSLTKDTSASMSDNHEVRIRELKNKRRTCKSQVTMFGHYLDSFKDSETERIKLSEQLLRIRGQFDTFNRVQDELGNIDNYDEAEVERNAATDIYDNVIARATVMLNRLASAAAPSKSGEHSSPANCSNGSCNPTATSSCSLPVNLPKMSLPKFDGRIESWLTFKDAFNNLIHLQPGLSKIQKLQYLQLSLSGKAEAAISAFTISNENYEAAWTHLSEMYDNRRALVLCHAALLRDSPSMPDHRSESVRDLVNHVQLHIRSLQALGRSWENIAQDLITSIIVSKMDEETKRNWERTLSDTEVPKLEEVIKFMHNASHQTEEFEPTNRATQNPYRDAIPPPTQSRPYHLRPRSPKTQYQKIKTYATKTSTREPPRANFDQRENYSKRQPPSPRPQRKTPRATAGSSCSICNSEGHAEYSCKRFIEMPVIHRIDAARKADLCMNCLRPGHRSEDCRGGTCQVCNQRHNTKLHQDAKYTGLTESKP
ncbi:uncharacterized protein LOC122403357 [Colletes gigas]|uniref:uncharacterized protein LOC122403357 n=1 Tax=Colletes gigas TaxID=935657 RepID=UPI001C9B1AA4|nr:uncharacterized protein LOC122403357 [Colletes gigas]